MSMILNPLKKILYWSYERGSWQYDILCVAILAFIFFAPNVYFNSGSSTASSEARRMLFVGRDEIGQVDEQRLAQAVAEHLSRKHGRTVSVERVEPAPDASGNLAGYIVWEKQ